MIRLKKVCGVFAIIGMSLLVCFGCSYNDSVQREEYTATLGQKEGGTVEPSYKITGETSLHLVESPVYGEEFFKIVTDNNTTPVSWGKGECFVDDRSGFPGFGYPIVVRGTGTTEDNEVAIATPYGNYVYLFTEKCTVRDVDGTLVRETGEELVDFTEKEEVLVTVSDDTAMVYRLLEGPEFVE